MSRFLKFEESVKIGDRVRAYDFEPMPGRKEIFIEGTVFDVRTTYEGKFFMVQCESDPTAPSEEYSRVGREVYVPMETMLDFDTRISVL